MNDLSIDDIAINDVPLHQTTRQAWLNKVDNPMNHVHEYQRNA